MKRLILVLAALPQFVSAQGFYQPGKSSTATFTSAPTFPGATSTGTVSTKGLVSTALTTPTNATFTATTGTLNNGSYCYRITALDAAGETLPSTETCLSVSGGAASNGVVVNWGAIAGATSYKVYGRLTGAELLMATVTAPTVTWTDEGSVTPSGALPTVGTSANISTTSGISGRDLTLSAASGAVAMSGANGAKFCPGTATACVTSDGTIFTTPPLAATTYLSTTSVYASSAYYGGTNAPMRLASRDNDDASGVGVAIYPNTTLTTAGAKILTGAPDTSNTVAFSVDLVGSYRQHTAPTLLTCAAGIRYTQTVQTAAAGKYDKLCLCVSDNQASPAFAWKNISGIFASEAASIGNTTTCPDP